MAHSLKIESMLARRHGSRSLEQLVTLHVCSENEEMNECSASFLLLFHLETQPLDDDTTFKLGFSIQLILSGKSFIGLVCFYCDSIVNSS